MKLAWICVTQVCVIKHAILCAVLMASRSWQHCRQLGDFLRVAGGEGSDATQGEFGIIRVNMKTMNKFIVFLALRL